jgi:hypothetical protein
LGGFSSLSLDLAFASAIAALFIALVYAGRDLAGGALGRFAGLALLVGLAFSPIAPEVAGVVLAVLAAAAALMLIDQLSRTSALHVASLDTSYGFYGSFSWSSWSALVLAGLMGTPLITSLLPDLLNHLEWSFVSGLTVGIVIGLLRIPIVRRQDREIKNLDNSNVNIANLLGL